MLARSVSEFIRIPVDEVVGHPVSADVQCRVGEELLLQHPAEADPIWLGHKDVGEKVVHDAHVAKQHDDRPRRHHLGPAHDELEPEDALHGGHDRVDPPGLERVAPLAPHRRGPARE